MNAINFKEMDLIEDIHYVRSSKLSYPKYMVVNNCSSNYFVLTCIVHIDLLVYIYYEVSRWLVAEVQVLVLGRSPRLAASWG